MCEGQTQVVKFNTISLPACADENHQELPVHAPVMTSIRNTGRSKHGAGRGALGPPFPRRCCWEGPSSRPLWETLAISYNKMTCLPLSQRSRRWGRLGGPVLTVTCRERPGECSVRRWCCQRASRRGDKDTVAVFISHLIKETHKKEELKMLGWGEGSLGSRLTVFRAP